MAFEWFGRRRGPAEVFALELSWNWMASICSLWGRLPLFLLSVSLYPVWHPSPSNKAVLLNIITLHIVPRDCWILEPLWQLDEGNAVSLTHSVTVKIFSFLRFRPGNRWPCAFWSTGPTQKLLYSLSMPETLCAFPVGDVMALGVGSSDRLVSVFAIPVIRSLCVYTVLSLHKESIGHFFRWWN